MTKKERVQAFLNDVNRNAGVSITAPYMNTELVNVLCERGLIPENKWNDYNPRKDADFLIGMLSFVRTGREMSEAQQRKVGILLDNITKAAQKNQKALTMRRDAWRAEQAKRMEREQKLPTVDDLTDEQRALITRVQNGDNVLVDACIGSGKTTTIQVLCGELPDKNILYLTYNRLLKEDAQKKIKEPNTLVTNYHGYAVGVLLKHGIKTTPSDAIQEFNRNIPKFRGEGSPLGKPYDVIILDEYQDVEQEIADELEFIKECNPGAQIVAVGDMQQKIYDKTTLDVKPFIEQYLGEHEDLTFTKCFRLSKEHAAMLGDIWGKEINGVNNECEIVVMDEKSVMRLLANSNPGDVLCLGNRQGRMVKVLNALEDEYPDIYNKQSVYASIKDEDRSGLDLSGDTAIFTTYDSSKGMERPLCVVFDFDVENWENRAQKPTQKYEILKNIFCVAASRGKGRIVFVANSQRHMLTPDVMKTPIEHEPVFNEPFFISDMFDHKYKEDIEYAFSLLKIKPKTFKGMDSLADRQTISIQSMDGKVDISPCIGNYQSAKFFKKYNVDQVIQYELSNMIKLGRQPRLQIRSTASLQEKLLYLTYLQTGHERYMTQVSPDFITKEQSAAICDRLKKVFDKKDDVEVPCAMQFKTPGKNGGYTCEMDGRIDVIRDDVLYELKFVDELSHTHFLQLACYLCLTGSEKGVLWNTKKNQAYTIKIVGRNRQEFMNAVVRAITKGAIKDFVPTENFRPVWEKYTGRKIEIGGDKKPEKPKNKATIFSKNMFEEYTF